MKKKTPAKWDWFITGFYFALYITTALTLLWKQPFGNPPDEAYRNLIPQYIGVLGRLPNGYEESIRIYGYGFSYAFQPILPYIAQGYFMRIMRHFTSDFAMLYYSTRLVNFLFGLITAAFVLLLARKWFPDKRLQYVFAFLVMFLPQSLFIHTYVNTDSCCMMSIAIMLYGLTRCLEDHFAYSSCLVMSVGIILCALSYYNAYGFILSCILLFIAHFLSLRRGKLYLDLKPFLKKGVFISALVLLGISWWFIRSYILYDGDFLGLRSRDACATLYAFPELKPGSRVTYASQGYSVLDMLLQSDFILVTMNSLICMYGPMAHMTAMWIYRFYKYFILITLLLCAVPPSVKILAQAPACSPRRKLWENRRLFRLFYHANMLFCILMPCILSVIYSHSIDYQPQGRYIIPALIPLFYYCVLGLEKGYRILCALLQRFIPTKKPAGETAYSHLLTGLCVLLSAVIVLALCVSVYGYALPYYAALE